MGLCCPGRIINKGMPGMLRSHDELFATLLDSILASVEEDKRLALKAALDASLDRLRPTVFSDVNAASMPEFLLDEGRWRQYGDGRAVHLELGTWIAWPDEVAEAYRQSASLGEVVRLDMQARFKPDVAASVTALPFADESMDRISSNSLFEHCPYPHEILKEAFRVLRPGGAFRTTMPFHFVEHGCPRDYTRLSGQFFEDVCADLGFVDVQVDTKSTSGVFYTTHNLLKAGIANREAPFGNELQEIHKAVLMLLAALQGLDRSFHAHGASLWHSTSVMAFKPGAYHPREDVFDRALPFYARFAEHLICPRTGLPLSLAGDRLVSADGRCAYAIVDGVPELFVMHGFGSHVLDRASSRDRLKSWQATRAQEASR